MSSKTFCIVSLVRSRTSWLSNLFTTDKTYCSHDIFADTGTVLSDSTKEYVGSTFTFLNTGDFDLSDYDRIAVVHRPLSDVLRSSLSAFIFKDDLTLEDRENLLEGPLKACKEVLDTMDGDNVKKFYYKDLSDNNTIEDMWKWLIPTIPADIERIELLQSFKINTNRLTIDI